MKNKNVHIKISIFWFRRDLRINDNHGLYEALKSSDKILPLFIFDKNILDELKDKKDRRVSFIYKALENLNKEFVKHDSSLFTIHDTPLNAFKTICNNFEVKAVYTNHDYEPYAIDRDKQISDFLISENIAFHTFKDQVMFEKSEVMKSDGTPYTVFTPYSKIWKSKLNDTGVEYFHSEKYLQNLYSLNKFKLISLKDIGFNKVDVEFKPVLPSKNIIKNYEESRNIPSVNGTSHMSAHLRFGTVSVRELAKLAQELNDQWLNELIWREFFMMILFHFPKIVTQSFKEKYDQIKWQNNKIQFKLWCLGETGYPMVDAGMRELNQTGFMHNRVRMITASFLTKHLLIDWRWGEAYFAEKLLDYELSSNNGNWQWAAGSGCDAAPYFRIFNPMTQQQKFDPDFIYIKKWIKDFKPGYIYPIIDHEYARKHALEVYAKAVRENYIRY
ncbi:deoxyribodipyrimidine photo-lyase [soil metagenome]